MSPPVPSPTPGFQRSRRARSYVAASVAFVATTRPSQWPKNVLVLAAPLAAGALTQPGVLASSLWAALSLGLASAGIYLVNDVIDVEADRSHPVKRRRPVASGRLAARDALIGGAVLLVVALTLSAAQSRGMLGVTGAYVAVQLAYCVTLKRQPVVELLCVASGFLLRAVAGGVAAHLPLSQWFLTTAGFGALFMVAGKRYAERVLVSRTGAPVRRGLEQYTETYLRFVWTMAASVLVLTYALWAFSISHLNGTPWSVISLAPFLATVLRYAVDVDGGQAGEPEDIVLRDRQLLATAVTWLLTFVAAVYL